MKTRVMVWDLPVRTFHWMLAGSFAAAYLLSETEKLRNIHVMFGYTVLGLVAFRLVWGFFGSRYARFRSFLYTPREAFAYLRGLLRGGRTDYVGHNPAGSYAIWLILGLAALTGVTGYATYNEIGGDALEEFHELLANAWLLVVGVHISGVIVSSLFHHENLARSMVTGYRQGEPGQAIRGAAVGVGALLLTGVLGFWGWTLAGGGPAAAVSADDGEYAAAAGLVAQHDDDDDDDD